MVQLIPLAYLITFTCYGTRLYGDEAGSVDQEHNVPGTPFLAPNPRRVVAEQRQMKQEAYQLDSHRRTVVLDALQKVCAHRGWTLLAAHVRHSHVHMVVTAEAGPEKVLNDVKAYASRALHQTGMDSNSRQRWTRHGSTRYLWKPEEIGAAIHYVAREQGEPMAVWERQ
ncbi:MAG: transposase [Acidobacteria bacterium]|nr:transposase [Acidobacteriota bacterium]